MSFDYDKYYGETKDALGPPAEPVVRFFEALPPNGGRVLDVGCGQGRDAIFVARLGYDVTGVDLSPNGIADLMRAGQEQGLRIKGVVADITAYEPDGPFDVILVDRTLHMLPLSPRLDVLGRLIDHVAVGGWLLIVDEPSNIEAFQAVIAEHRFDFETERHQRGYLFVQRV